MKCWFINCKDWWGAWDGEGIEMVRGLRQWGAWHGEGLETVRGLRRWGARDGEGLGTVRGSRRWRARYCEGLETVKGSRLWGLETVKGSRRWGDQDGEGLETEGLRWWGARDPCGLLVSVFLSQFWFLQWNFVLIFCKQVKCCIYSSEIKLVYQYTLIKYSISCF